MNRNDAVELLLTLAALVPPTRDEKYEQWLSRAAGTGVTFPEMKVLQAMTMIPFSINRYSAESTIDAYRGAPNFVHRDNVFGRGHLDGVIEHWSRADDMRARHGLGLKLAVK